MNPNLKSKLEKLIANTEIDERETLYQLRKIVDEVAQQSYTTTESQSISELLKEELEEINIRMSSKGKFGLQTGFRELDSYGIDYGELVVIGARPGMRKTGFVLGLARNIAIDNEIPILYFSFDMSKTQLMQRLISMETEISAEKIRRGELQEYELLQLTSKIDKLNESKLLFNDSGNYSVSAIREICQTHIEKDGVKVIFIDHLQMISARNSRYNREAEISYITRELKNIARDFGVAVIVNSQLSRSVETRGGDKKPILSDLRDSGTIEQEADKVLFLYRGEYYGLQCDENGDSTRGVAELIIAKNRNGQLGTVKLKFINQLAKFEDFNSFFEENEKVELNENHKQIFKKFQSRMKDLDLTETPPTFDDDFLPPF